jgi:nitrate/nitrite transporter NarK
MSRLARFLQLEGGWLVPILLMVLIILPVFSMNDAKWVDRTQELLPIALLGGIIGILFAKSRINRAHHLEPTRRAAQLVLTLPQRPVC